MVVPCKSVFNGIICRSYLENLDVVASSVHLKVTYHNNIEKLIILDVDLKAARRLCEAILEIFPTTLVVS